MKKLLETSLDYWYDTWFSLNGEKLSDEDVLSLIKTKCDPHKTGDEEGVVIYMSKRAYEILFEDKVIRY